MGRGHGRTHGLCEKAKDRLYTHQWSYQTDEDGKIATIESARHARRVVLQGGRYRITDERGMFLRGPAGRIRVFASPYMAMIAADKA